MASSLLVCTCRYASAMKASAAPSLSACCSSRVPTARLRNGAAAPGSTRAQARGESLNLEHHTLDAKECSTGPGPCTKGGSGVKRARVCGCGNGEGNVSSVCGGEEAEEAYQHPHGHDVHSRGALVGQHLQPARDAPHKLDPDVRQLRHAPRRAALHIELVLRRTRHTAGRYVPVGA